MTRSKEYLIPFSRESGDLEHYAGHEGDKYYEWRKNYMFSDTLTLIQMHRGRSAKYVEWMDSEGRTYPMFVKDFLDLAMNHKIVKGKATGQWTFQKRGQNFGVRLHVGWDNL